METIAQFVKQKCKINAQNIAIGCNGKYLTYADLCNEIEKIKVFLRKKNIAPNDEVALCLPNSPLFVAAFFAIAGLGGIATTLNVNYKKEEINRYLDSNRIKYFTSEQFYEAIDSKENGHESYRGKNWEKDAEVLRQFSSGSTGVPKKIGRNHNHILSEAKAISRALQLSPSDTIFCPVPLFHAYGFGCGMMASLYSGATLMLTDRFNPHRIIDIFQEEKITIFFGVPYMFKMLSKAMVNEKMKVSSLRYCFSAGISLPASVAREFYDTFGIFPRELYGTTETGCLSINLNEDIEKNLDSIGKPIEKVEIGVTSDHELQIKTPAMGQYYYFKDGTVSPVAKGGYFYPGDIGRKDKTGNISITGRKTKFINVAGTKVDPFEVEEVLRSHPLIKDAAVLGAPDELRGESVKAFIVLVNRRVVARKEVVQYCRTQLADFKVPRIIEIRDSIPVSPLGKVLKGRL